jgi:hypothetical protein
MNMNRTGTQKAIENVQTVLGIEFGSTRIKTVRIGEDRMPIVSGSCEFEYRYENGVWTDSLKDIWTDLQSVSVNQKMVGVETRQSKYFVADVIDITDKCCSVRVDSEHI